jgi:hypothetical protein
VTVVRHFNGVVVDLATTSLFLYLNTVKMNTEHVLCVPSQLASTLSHTCVNMSTPYSYLLESACIRMCECARRRLQAHLRAIRRVVTGGSPFSINGGLLLKKAHEERQNLSTFSLFIPLFLIEKQLDRYIDVKT